MSDRNRGRGGSGGFPQDGTQPLSVGGDSGYAAVDHAGKTRPIDVGKLGLEFPPEPEPEPDPEPERSTRDTANIQQRRRGQEVPPVVAPPASRATAGPAAPAHRGPSVGADEAETRILGLLRADRPAEALRIAAEFRADPAAPVRARFQYLMLVCHVRAAQNLGETVQRAPLPIAWRDHLADLMRALDTVNPLPPKR